MVRAERSSRAAGTVLLLCVATLTLPDPVRAQDTASPPPSSPSAASASAPAPAIKRIPAPRLEYKTVAGCPNEATFRSKLALLLRNEDPFLPDAPDVLRVRFEKVAGGYRGTVQYVPAQGDPWPAESETGALCTHIIDAVLGTASLRARPTGTPQPDPEPAPPPEPEPAADPIPPPEPSQPPPVPVASSSPRVARASFEELRLQPPPPPPPDPMDLTVTLSTAFVLTAGLTDNVGPAVQIGASARRDWDTWGISLGLEFRGVFPAVAVARELVDVDPMQTPPQPAPFDVSQLGAQLVPCVHFAKYLAGCGVVQGFLLFSQDSNWLSSLPGWGLGPRFAVEVPFAERFAVFGFAEALFALWRVDVPFRAEEGGPGVIWKQPIVSGFVGVGLSVRFK